MKIINADVTYITEEDLVIRSRNKQIEEVSLRDLSDMNIVRKANILIIKISSKYRILKSRY